MSPPAQVEVRRALPSDFEQIVALCRRVYPGSPPWRVEQLTSHHRVFPEGQLVVTQGGQVMGFAASLIIRWDDYDSTGAWRDFTAAGTFSNHDPERGRTLYGAEVMVDPDTQGHGVGSKLYEARFALARDKRLLRIRAGARLRGYHRHAGELEPREYVRRVVRGELDDPTLSFQLHRGFRVLDVVGGYLAHDSESLGYAAVIEWLNPDVATEQERLAQEPKYLR